MSKLIGLALGGFSKFFKKAVIINRRLYENSAGRDESSLSKKKKKG